jgi:rhomboid protease GluP
MPTCVHCGCDLPGVERICRACYDKAYADGFPPRKTPSERVARFLRLSPVVSVLIAVNVFVFVLMAVQRHSVFGAPDRQLIAWGGDYGPLTLNGQWWRMLTSTFVHFDLGHVFFNMLCLERLGSIAERAFGKLAFLFGYLSAGLCASAVSTIFHPQQVCIGASGAVFGIVGFLIIPLFLRKLSIGFTTFATPLKTIVLFTLYNLVVGWFTPEIDNSAHVGGLLFGLAFGLLFTRRQRSVLEAAEPHVTARR